MIFLNLFENPYFKPNIFSSLISKLNEGNLFSQPSFEAILPLMDNYIPDVRQSEDHTAEEQMEEEVFLDVIVGNINWIIIHKIKNF